MPADRKSGHGVRARPWAPSNDGASPNARTLAHTRNVNKTTAKTNGEHTWAMPMRSGNRCTLEKYAYRPVSRTTLPVIYLKRRVLPLAALSQLHRPVPETQKIYFYSLALLARYPTLYARLSATVILQTQHPLTEWLIVIQRAHTQDTQTRSLHSCPKVNLRS